MSDAKPARLPLLFVRYFVLFWAFARARMMILVVLTLAMTYAEAIGIALFFPLFEPDPAASSSGVGHTIASFLDLFGIAMTPASVLPSMYCIAM